MHAMKTDTIFSPPVRLLPQEFCETMCAAGVPRQGAVTTAQAADVGGWNYVTEHRADEVIVPGDPDETRRRTGIPEAFFMPELPELLCFSYGRNLKTYSYKDGFAHMDLGAYMRAGRREHFPVGCRRRRTRSEHYAGVGEHASGERRHQNDLCHRSGGRRFSEAEEHSAVTRGA